MDYIDKLRKEDQNIKKTKQDIIEEVEEAKIIIQELLLCKNKTFSFDRAYNEKKIPVYFLCVAPNQYGIFGADEKGDFFSCVQNNAKAAWAFKEGFTEEEASEKVKTYKNFEKIEDFIDYICKPQIEMHS
jgi:hypothetical protein